MASQFPAAGKWESGNLSLTADDRLGSGKQPRVAVLNESTAAPRPPYPRPKKLRPIDKQPGWLKKPGVAVCLGRC